MKIKILFLVSILISPLATLLGSTTESQVERKAPLYKINNFYQTEENYHYIMEHSISFKNVSFKSYTVVKGDNFWKIAKRNNINIDSLIAANPHWESLLARCQQKIIIPSTKGTLLFIKAGESIDDLATYFEVDKSQIEVQYMPSYFKYHSSYDQLPLGIAVFIHDTKPDVNLMTQKMGHQYTLREMFRSPLGGRFTSFFGVRTHPIFNKKKFHSGVDIAAKRGTYIGAACDGRVVYAGWNGGYGKCVIIQHKNGYKTLYGHMSKINASVGKHVKAGQLIGRVGSTGYSTGPHLHFTVWHNGKLINPMDVLW